MRKLDLTGQRFGRLVAVAPAENCGKGTRWLCKCDCGGEKIVVTSYLKTGRTKSCGCLRIDTASQHGHESVKHGCGKHPLYNVWKNMKARCYDPECEKYRIYGARGIRVCDEWRYDIKSFVEWAESHGYQRGLQIDRIDVNGDYCPENCHWVTNKENANNKRDTIFITVDGETHSQAEWCRIIGHKSSSGISYARRKGVDIATYIRKRIPK